MPAPRLSTVKLDLPAAAAPLAAGVLTVLVIVGVAIGPQLGAMITQARFQPHAPDLSPLIDATLAIQVHVAGALTALVIGIVQLIGVKGTRVHKILGWTWVGAMAFTALSSFAIHQINPGGLSFIHALSGWTVISLPMAVWAIRRGKVKAHARAMTGLFVGGLVVAGLLTFLPGRIMWRIIFG